MIYRFIGKYKSLLLSLLMLIGILVIVFIPLSWDKLRSLFGGAISVMALYNVGAAIKELKK
jgi:hypothetical protein